MAIDWLTVSAQVINFLILVFLLKRFLYRPILETMNSRKQRIDDDIEKAKQKNVRAEALCHQYEAKLAELENHRNQLLEQAKQKAELKRLALLEDIREEIEIKRSQWWATLDREQLAGRHELKTTIIHQVSAISRRALRDLAGCELELEMMRQLIHRFEIHSGDKETFLRAISAHGDKLTVSSTHNISEQHREKMTALLQGFLNKEIQIDFEPRSDMICGIGLEAGGQRWEWSIDSYLNDLNAAVSSLVTPITGQPHHV